MTFPDAGSPDGIYEVLRQHIVEPATVGLRSAVIIHNVLTTPYREPLKQALRRVIAEVARKPALTEKAAFIAWTHDVFNVPHEMVPGVTYVTVSEERQRILAEYFHQPPSRIPVTRNAVNLRRTLDLSPEADWLASTFRLCEEDFVAVYPVRLARNKNLEAAIEIVAALNRLGRATTLLVPGLTADWQRDYYAELRERASALKVPEKVIFLTDLTFEGRPLTVTDEVIRDLYKLASFLLFTSRDEGFGLPLIEAACMRLPAVISPLPTLLSISRDAGTLVVDPDHESLDQIARRIVDHVTGSPIYRMQKRAFSLYNMAHQFEAIGWRLSRWPRGPCRIGAQCTNYFSRRRIEDQFLDSVYNGLDAFEVFFDPQPQRQLGFNPEDLQEDLRYWLRERARKQDVQLSVSARRRSSDAAERRSHWRRCLDFAQDIGAALLAVDLPPPRAFGDTEFTQFVRDLRELIDLAGPQHIQIAVENGSHEDPDGTRFLTSAQDLNDLFLQLDRDGNLAGVSFNAGRAHLLEDAASYLRDIQPPILHVKLSDNSGPGHDEVHQRLGEGELPLAPVLDELNRRGYHGTIILEYFYADLRRDRTLIEAALASPAR